MGFLSGLLVSALLQSGLESNLRVQQNINQHRRAVTAVVDQVRSAWAERLATAAVRTVERMSGMQVMGADDPAEGSGGPVSARPGESDRGVAQRTQPMSSSVRVDMIDMAGVSGTIDGESVPSRISRPPVRRVLVFKAAWCGACRALDSEWPRLREVGWRVGSESTDHFQFIDVDEHPELMERYGVALLPTLVLVENGREVARRGSLTARNLAELYYGRLR